MKILTKSDIESDRFGITIARATNVPEESASTLADEMTQNSIDLVILRTPANDNAIALRLMELGLRILPADTLVYYQVSLEDWHCTSPPGDFKYCLAESEDGYVLAELTRQGFDGYLGHYAASPRLKKELVLDGYVDWANRYSNGLIPKSVTMTAKKNGDIVGYIAGQFVDEDDTEFELSLSAIDRRVHKQGLYTNCMISLLEHLQSRGAKRAYVSSQVWNYAVQRSWSKIGFKIYHSVSTFHVSLHKF